MHTLQCTCTYRLIGIVHTVTPLLHNIVVVMLSIVKMQLCVCVMHRKRLHKWCMQLCKICAFRCCFYAKAVHKKSIFTHCATTTQSIMKKIGTARLWTVTNNHAKNQLSTSYGLRGVTVTHTHTYIHK